MAARVPWEHEVAGSIPAVLISPVRQDPLRHRPLALLDAQSQSFTIPAGAGTYAPERIYVCRGDLGLRGMTIARITALVTQLVATAVLELWMLKDGADPSLDASYFLYSAIANGAALGGATLDVATSHAQLRAKSGGTAGTLNVSVKAYSFRDA